MLSVIKAAYEAGQEIMKIYQTDFDVEYKEDESPLTIADMKSHEVIQKALKENYPEIPILSEEGKNIAYEERSAWEKFWLVDPIDGTKEFIKKNDEFTVNIALIEQGKPVFGVIYAPALDTFYVGQQSKGSYKLENAEAYVNSLENLEDFYSKSVVLPLQDKQPNQVKVVASRSHMSKETEEFIEGLKRDYKQVETLSAGSSLKLCLVAEGAADFYPRYAPTMEWDTGAGQAIVEHAGGQVTIAGGSNPLRYNKEDLRNPWFLAKLNR
ncbi:3'(2'),5'-bisphosphate nucleotidase CysQ [Thalassobacillus devorans]|uniref:3'(2'),5'-bisphosphate nucleotidase CysQ n=1 Tax=Thalassobacillus devorans TaxID=279813 RepID=UPI0004AEF16B|nr:3'(2'),5'-bisphosphate nucleotidase CysQ [Thalassobacillus devorans]